MSAVETAARAIIRRRASVGDALGPPLKGKRLDQYVDRCWRWWTDDARAAIASLREPGESVITALWLRMRESDAPDLLDAVEAWAAAIDAALSEPRIEPAAGAAEEG